MRIGKQKYAIVGAFLIVAATFCGLVAVIIDRGKALGEECREVGNRYDITADSPVYASSTIGVQFRYPKGYRVIEATLPEREYRPDIAIYPDTAGAFIGPQLWIFYPTGRDKAVNSVANPEAYSQDYISTEGLTVRIHSSTYSRNGSLIILRQHYDAAPFGKQARGKTVYDVNNETADRDYLRYVILASGGNGVLIVKGPRQFTSEDAKAGLSIECQGKELALLLDNIAATFTLTN